MGYIKESEEQVMAMSHLPLSLEVE